MSDDGRRLSLPASHRGKIAAGIVAILILFVGVAAAAHIAGTLESSGPNSIQAQDGMNATLTGSGQAYWQSNFPTSGTAELITEQGNVSFYSSGAAAATVHISEVEGTWTNVSGITADPNTITITPGDKSAAVVGQEIDTFAWRSAIAASDGTADFSYSASGPARVTVQGLSDARVAAIDASSGDILDTAQASGGSVTFDSLPSGTHDVFIQTFSPATPTLSNADPTGDTTIAPAEVSIDVSDGDFPRGDSVTVTIDVDGSQVHTETISSNQTVTASVSASAQTGGQHSWSVEASDSYGETTTDSYTYTVPDELTIYNETAPSQVVDNVDVTLQFYQRDTVVTRNTSDGNVSLTGLPVTEDLVVLAQADGYYTRRTFIGSIYQQQEIYLLPENTTSSSIVFTLDDRTGNFPPGDTVLMIQRPLTKDFDGDGTDETEYRTVAGDYFGAAGSFPVELETDTRYRLTARNDQGDVRALGSYTVTGDAAETIPIGQVAFSETQTGSVVMQGSLTDYNNSRYVRVAFRDFDNKTSALEYRVVRVDNESKVLQSNVTVSNPRSYSATIQVPESAPDDVGYAIQWTATRTGVEDTGGEEYVGDVPGFLRNIGLGGTVASYLAFVGLAALVGLVVIYDDRLAAMTGVIGATGLSLAGIVTIHPIALGIAGTIAILYVVARQ